MAEDPKGGGVANNGALLIALLSFGTLIFNQYAPLQGARPPNEGPALRVQASAQDVDARLWQDPFATVAKAAAEPRGAVETKSGGRRCGTPISQLMADGSLSAQEAEKVIVLAVTTSGAPYPEDEEQRRRLRYAVVSALSVRGFVPVDDKHIGYFVLRRESPSDRQDVARATVEFMDVLAQHATEADPGGLALSAAPAEQAEKPTSISCEPDGDAEAIPFELFRPRMDSPGFAKVLVLWLDEDRLNSSPVSRLAQIATGLGAPSMRVIGPKSSDTLRSIVLETMHADVKTPAPANEHGHIRLYAYGATVDDETLLGEFKLKNNNVHDYLKDKGIYLFRTVTTDGVLARAIKEELAARVIVRGPDKPIALVSEWNSYYGRTFPEAMRRALAGTPSGPPVSEKNGASAAVSAARNEQVITRTYLRGLDGALPKTDKDKKKSDEAQNGAPGDKAAKDRADPRAADLPFGQSQYDYLRRLAADLKAEDDRRWFNQRARIAAIGVVGSDVFDKLLVLRALKPQFPEAQFFTTDYDALLTMQSELGWTRNLLIASSFGPRLTDVLQGDIPPFRDAYETAAFFSTQLAVHDACKTGRCAAAAGADLLAKVADQEGISGLITPARMFEIARGGEILDAERRPPSASSAHPSGKAAYSVLGLYFFILPAFAYGVAALLYSRGRRRAGEKRAAQIGDLKEARPRGFAEFLYRSYWPLLAIASALCVFAFAIGAYFYGAPSSFLGEPIVLFSGVSLLVPIFLRFVGIFLGFWLICVAFDKLKRNIETIDSTFFRSVNRGDRYVRELVGELIENTKYFFNNIPKCIYNVPEYEEYKGIYVFRIESSWECYKTQVGTIRFWRVACCWVAPAWLLTGMLFYLSGNPFVPARSGWSLSLYMITTFADVSLMFFLVFLTADATLLCWLFVRRLADGQSEWPPETRQEYVKNLNLERAVPQPGPEAVTDLYSTQPKIQAPKPRGDIDKNALDDWIDLAFISKRTECVNGLIWFPFGFIALMIVSRSSIFANFPISTPIVITQAIGLVIVVGCAVALNGAAERARAFAQKRFRLEVVRAKAQGDEKSASFWECVLNRATTLREGSFQPFLQQPVVGAILLPVGSIGWTAVLEKGLLGL